MAPYFFHTQWILEAPMREVFDALTSPDDLLSWWPAIRRARLMDRGDERGVGARASYSIQSPLLYRVHFELTSTDLDPPRRIRGLATGDLVGTSDSILEEGGAATTVHFHWYVSTTKRWMNLMTPVARPLFIWAHDRVMKQGCAALARHLDIRAVSATTNLIDRPMPSPGPD